VRTGGWQHDRNMGFEGCGFAAGGLDDRRENEVEDSGKTKGKMEEQNDWESIRPVAAVRGMGMVTEDGEAEVPKLDW
jgi:hypothetical protein